MNLNDGGFSSGGRFRKARKANIITVQFGKQQKKEQGKKRKACVFESTTTTTDINWKNSSNPLNFDVTSTTTTSYLDGSDPDSRVIIAVTEGRGEATHEVGLASVNVEKPILILCQISDTQSYTNVLRKLYILDPIEILIPITMTHSRLTEKIKSQFPHVKITGVPRVNYNKANGLQYVESLCAPAYNSIRLIVQYKYYALTATGALLWYIENHLYRFFGRETIKVEYQEAEDGTIIDIVTADKLELVACAIPRMQVNYSSLRAVLNHCKTTIGHRTLRASILQPLCSVPEIEKRLNCVEELIQSPERIRIIQEQLKQIVNIDRLLSLATLFPTESQSCSHRQLNYLLLLNTLFGLIEPLGEMFKTSQQPLFVELRETLNSKDLVELKKIVGGIIHSNARTGIGEQAVIERCFMIKSGISGLLDLIRQRYSEQLEHMRLYVDNLGEKYNLNLKLKNNSKKGYHIAMALTGRLKKTFRKIDLPDEFILVQRMNTMVTMKTTELLTYSSRLEDIAIEILKMSNVIIFDTLVEIRKRVSVLYSLCELIAKLDVLQSLATVSSNDRFVKPSFGDLTEVNNGRHPLLEYLCREEPTPNDIIASPYYNMHIITGPNNSGKSIYIRQVVLLQVMAQIGCYVPASSATFKVADRILARIYLEDNINFGASTFLLELLEIKYFLNVLTDNTLIIIDELCRSTTVDEGTALAIAICERFTHSRAFVFFATHYTFVASLYDMYPNVKCWQLDAQEIESNGIRKLKYTHAVIPGILTMEDYALCLARVSWPADVISDVEAILKVTKKCKHRRNAYRMDPRFRLKYDAQASLHILKSKGQLTMEKVEQVLLKYETDLQALGTHISWYTDSVADRSFGSLLNPDVSFHETGNPIKIRILQDIRIPPVEESPLPNSLSLKELNSQGRNTFDEGASPCSSKQSSPVQDGKKFTVFAEVHQGSSNFSRFNQDQVCFEMPSSPSISRPRTINDGSFNFKPFSSFNQLQNSAEMHLNPMHIQDNDQSRLSQNFTEFKTPIRPCSQHFRHSQSPLQKISENTESISFMNAFQNNFQTMYSSHEQLDSCFVMKDISNTIDYSKQTGDFPFKSPANFKRQIKKRTSPNIRSSQTLSIRQSPKTCFTEEGQNISEFYNYTPRKNKFRAAMQTSIPVWQNHEESNLIIQRQSEDPSVQNRTIPSTPINQNIETRTDISSVSERKFMLPLRKSQVETSTPIAGTLRKPLNSVRNYSGIAKNDLKGDIAANVCNSQTIGPEKTTINLSRLGSSSQAHYRPNNTILQNSMDVSAISDSSSQKSFSQYVNAELVQPSIVEMFDQIRLDSQALENADNNSFQLPQNMSKADLEMHCDLHSENSSQQFQFTQPNLNSQQGLGGSQKRSSCFTQQSTKRGKFEPFFTFESTPLKHKGESKSEPFRFNSQGSCSKKGATEPFNFKPGSQSHNPFDFDGAVSIFGKEMGGVFNDQTKESSEPAGIQEDNGFAKESYKSNEFFTFEGTPKYRTESKSEPFKFNSQNSFDRKVATEPFNFRPASQNVSFGGITFGNETGSAFNERSKGSSDLVGNHSKNKFSKENCKPIDQVLEDEQNNNILEEQRSEMGTSFQKIVSGHCSQPKSDLEHQTPCLVKTSSNLEHTKTTNSKAGISSHYVTEAEISSFVNNSSKVHHSKDRSFINDSSKVDYSKDLYLKAQISSHNVTEAEISSFVNDSPKAHHLKDRSFVNDSSKVDHSKDPYFKAQISSYNVTEAEITAALEDLHSCTANFDDEWEAENECTDKSQSSTPKKSEPHEDIDVSISYSPDYSFLRRYEENKRNGMSTNNITSSFEETFSNSSNLQHEPNKGSTCESNVTSSNPKNISKETNFENHKIIDTESCEDKMSENLEESKNSNSVPHNKKTEDELVVRQSNMHLNNPVNIVSSSSSRTDLVNSITTDSKQKDLTELRTTFAMCGDSSSPKSAMECSKLKNSTRSSQYEKCTTDEQSDVSSACIQDISRLSKARYKNVTSVSSSEDDLKVKRNRFKPPEKKPINKLSKKEIESYYRERDREAMSSTDPDFIKRYSEEMMNRPSAKQIRQSRLLATAFKTESGSFSIAAPEPKTNKRRKFMPPLKKQAHFDATIFSDENADLYKQFLQSEPDSEQERQMLQRFYQPSFSDQQATFSRSSSQSSTRLTPDGYYKENKLEINQIMKKYL